MADSKSGSADNKAQVRADFQKMPWYKKAAVAADDVVRLAANGLTFGGLDALIGGDAAQRTSDAATRAGFAGDVADAAGTLVGPFAALKGAKPALNAVKGAVRKVTIPGGIAALVGGAATTNNYLSRTRDERVASRRQAAAAQAPAAPSRPSTAFRDMFEGAVDQTKPQPPRSIDEAVANILQQSESLSINDLIGLSQAQGQAARGEARPAKPRDVAFAQLMQLQDANYQNMLAAADASDDPETGRQAATQWLINQRKQLMGVNQFDMPSEDDPG